MWYKQQLEYSFTTKKSNHWLKGEILAESGCGFHPREAYTVIPNVKDQPMGSQKE
jgi:hypothetical protein